MATAYQQTQGFNLPSWTYQNQEPLNIVKAIEEGIGLGNLVLDQPLLNKGRKIQKMQQEQVLSGEMPMTGAQTTREGLVQGNLKDRAMYDAELAQQEALTQERLADAQLAQQEAASFGQPDVMSPIDEARLATEMAREENIRQQMGLREIGAQPQGGMVEKQTGVDEQGNPIFEMVPVVGGSFWKEKLPSGEEVTMMMGPGGRPVPYKPTADPFEQTMRRELAKTETKAYDADFAGAESAYASLPKLYQMKQLAMDNQLNTGVGANIKTNIGRFQSLANEIISGGRSRGLNDDVIKDQLMDAFMGQNVFPLIGALGIGARGLDTPAEKTFLLETFSGSRAMEPETIAAITQVAIDLNEKRIQNYNKKLDEGRFNLQSEILGRKLQPYDVSQIRPQGYTPATILNPGTSAVQQPQGVRNAPGASPTGGGKIYIINGKPVKQKQ